MKLFRKKEAWIIFYTKLVIFIVFLSIFIFWFKENYQFAIDSQKIQCLPDHSVYLINKQKTLSSLQRGEIYAFKSKNMQPFFKDNTIVAKILVALPGDLIEIKENTDILVNGKKISEGLYLADKLAIPINSFVGKKILGDGEYWFLGKTKESFDSRYWGSVNYEQIIGKTYPLF